MMTKRYARIVNGHVIETMDIRDDQMIETMFHPDVVWRPVPEYVTDNWRESDDSWVPDTTKPPTATIVENDDSKVTIYAFRFAGQYLPMHEHDFNHDSILLHGGMLVRYADGREQDFSVPRSSVVFPAQQVHEITATVDNTVIAQVQHLDKT
jgi:hypothetical protein